MVACGLYAVDMLVLAGAFGLSYALRDAFGSDRFGPLVDLSQYGLVFGFAVVLWSILLVRFGLYDSFRTRSFTAEALGIAKVAFWSTLLLGTVTFALKMHFVSRLLLAVLAVTAAGLFTLERAVVRLLARKLRRRGYNTRFVLVVGTGSRARQIASMIEKNRHWGFRLLGLASDRADEGRRRTGPYEVIASIEDLPTVLRTQVVDEVIFAVSRKRLEELEGLFLTCEELGIRARVAVNFFPHMIARVELEEMEGIPMLTFSTTPSNEFTLAVKRTFDVAVSTGLLLLLSPLLLAIAAAVKLGSRGPVLFKQTRIGLSGRRFRLYKFRSMVEDAEARRADVLHLNEMSGPVFKVRNDPRLTPVGALLRRTSLDELPQLFNVLRGDMSIVGPRPPIPEEVAQYEPWQRRRLSMKPGLTCLWQVNGRNQIVDFARWMELDLQYIDNWSLGLDLKIFLRTIPTVLLGRGAA
jgi:exopolysaccharide biosynthesis polyprenyl glycosylphosphotransferase